MAANRPEPEARPGRILIVDDSPDNLDILATRLRFRGYEVEVATRGVEALEKVAERTPDLILLDVMMPGVDGYEVARRIKRDPSLPFIPIILITARDSTQDKVTGLDAGADDYLTKPIDYPELEARVRSMLRIKELQDELEEKNQELEHLSISDGLTGLYNHRHVQQLLHEEFERAKRTGEPLGVVMLDFDRFKEVNDTHGHQVGDQVLRELADILRHTAREIDKLGRYGGEEFIALLPDTGIDAAATFAERVRARVETHDFAADRGEEFIALLPDTGIDAAATFAERVRARVETHDFAADRGEPLRLTISAGAATYPHPAVHDQQSLVKRADQALYAAKEGGRNRVVRFTPNAA